MEHRVLNGGKVNGFVSEKLSRVLAHTAEVDI